MWIGLPLSLSSYYNTQCAVFIIQFDLIGREKKNLAGIKGRQNPVYKGLSISFDRPFSLSSLSFSSLGRAAGGKIHVASRRELVC
jgi:hypothetical protein